MTIDDDIQHFEFENVEFTFILCGFFFFSGGSVRDWDIFTINFRLDEVNNLQLEFTSFVFNFNSVVFLIS